MEQRDRQFAPRLLAVPVGSTVAFPNFDPIYHNVFSRSQVTPFDLGTMSAVSLSDVTITHTIGASQITANSPSASVSAIVCTRGARIVSIRYVRAAGGTAARRRPG